ncbi:MAG: YraN family protein [Alistipes sp.]
MATPTAEIGCAGERAATDFLRARGYQILDLNWRNGHYELDIVAEYEGILHLVEVKTRRAQSLTTPEEAITTHKFRSLSRAAKLYVAYIGWQGEVQFDLAAVERLPDGQMQVELIENAMEYNW